MKMLGKIVSNYKKSFVRLFLAIIFMCFFNSYSHALVGAAKNPNKVDRDPDHLIEVRKQTLCYDIRDFAFSLAAANGANAVPARVEIGDILQSEAEAYNAHARPVDGISYGFPSVGITIQKSVCNVVKTIDSNGSDWQEPKIRVVYRAASENFRRDLTHGECKFIGITRFCARYAASGTHGNRTDEERFGPPRTLLCAYEDPADAFDTKWSYNPYHQFQKDYDSNFLESTFGTDFFNQVVVATLGCVDVPLAVGPQPWSNDEWHNIAIPIPTLIYSADTDFFDPKVELVFCQKNSGSFSPIPCRFERDGEYKFRVSAKNATALEYGRGDFAPGVRQAFSLPLNPHAGRDFTDIVTCTLLFAETSQIDCAGQNANDANPTSHSDTSTNYNVPGGGTQGATTGTPNVITANIGFTASITKNNPSKVCIFKTQTEGKPTNERVGCINRPGFMPYPNVKFTRASDELVLYDKPEDLQNGVNQGYTSQDYEKVKLEVTFSGDPHSQQIETEESSYTYTPAGATSTVTETIASQRFLQFFNAFYPDQQGAKYKDNFLDFTKKMNMRCGYIHQIRLCIAPQGKGVNTKMTYSDEIDSDGKQGLASDATMCLTNYATPPRAFASNINPQILNLDKNAGPQESLEASFYVHRLPLILDEQINSKVVSGEVIHNSEHFPILQNNIKVLEQIPLDQNSAPANGNAAVAEAWVSTPFTDQKTGAHLPLNNADGTVNQVNYTKYSELQALIQEEVNGEPKYITRALNSHELGLCNGPIKISANKQELVEYTNSGSYNFTVPDECEYLQIVALGSGSSAHIGYNSSGQYVGWPGSPGALVVAKSVPVTSVGQRVNIVVAAGGEATFYGNVNENYTLNGMWHEQGLGSASTVSFGTQLMVSATGGASSGPTRAGKCFTDGSWACDTPVSRYDYNLQSVLSQSPRGWLSKHFYSQWGEMAHFPKYVNDSNGVNGKYDGYVEVPTTSTNPVSEARGDEKDLQVSDIECHGYPIRDGNDPEFVNSPDGYHWLYKDTIPGNKQAHKTLDTGILSRYASVRPLVPPASSTALAQGVGGCVHVLPRDRPWWDSDRPDAPTMQAGYGGDGYVSIKCSQWERGVDLN